MISKVWAVYFSATGTTKKITEHIAQYISHEMNVDFKIIDFTMPHVRNNKIKFTNEDLVIFGSPVYAGRIPNVLLPFLKEKIGAKNTYVVPIVLFGNRNYDDALKELIIILEKNGFETIAAGAFVGEHSFSNILAAGRPDQQDMMVADELGGRVIKRICKSETIPVELISIKKDDVLRPYYMPMDRNGLPINILKVKPKTNSRCKKCGLCAEICPMGSINSEDQRIVSGICIKCGACIKKCPASAKYFDDTGYLYHKHELEAMYSRRAEPIIY